MNSDAAKRICLLAQQNRRGIVQNIFTVFTRFSYVLFLHVSRSWVIMTAMPDWSFHERFLDEGPVTEQGERVFFVTQITGTHTGNLILPDLPIIPPTGTKISLPYRHLEYFVKEKIITTITADFSPNALEEILAQMGMVLPW